MTLDVSLAYLKDIIRGDIQQVAKGTSKNYLKVLKCGLKTIFS